MLKLFSLPVAMMILHTPIMGQHVASVSTSVPATVNSMTAALEPSSKRPAADAPMIAFANAIKGADR